MIARGLLETAAPVARLPRLSVIAAILLAGACAAPQTDDLKVFRESFQAVHGVSTPILDELSSTGKSMMPEGLLSTLDREEVVDLIAYLLSRGDRESKLFR